MSNPLDKISQHSRAEMLELQRELASRQLESVRLYRPNANQKPIHDCMANEIVVLGGNRSGKTTCALMEVAMAVTGTHPVPGKYPKENGTLVIVGADWRHIGMVIHRGLFKAGAFKIIRDAHTKEWRAYDPVADKDREAEAKPAPPLIPPRLIKQCSYVLKSAGYINSCELTNGWQIYFFSSEGDPPQGYRASIAWIDEDLSNESTWLAELQARLADYKGRLLWSATPHSRNDALWGLCERADKAAEEGLEHIKKFTLRFLDNQHISPEARALAIEQWSAQGEEVLRMRAEGEFTFDSVLMYGNFNMGIHGYDKKLLPDGQIPADWCRYAAVDPGHAICAVLFAAVPPDESFILLYDELYIPNCSAVIFGERFYEKTKGQPQFYAFYIDSHGARLTDIGGGKSPGQQYSEQLAALGVASRSTGASFMPGADDVMAGIESVRNALHIRPNGTPTLRVLTESLPNFVREMKRYKRQSTVVGGQTIIQDKPHPRSVSHLLDCMRYLMAAGIRYHKPPPVVEKPWWFDWRMRREKDKNQGGVVYLSPTSYTTETWVA